MTPLPASGRAFWSGDYVNDTRFSHGRGADQYVSGSGLHSVMAAPLTVEGVGGILQSSITEVS